MTDNDEADKADLAERLQARLDAGLAEAASWQGSHVADCIVRALRGEPGWGVQPLPNPAVVGLCPRCGGCPPAVPVAAGALEAEP